MKAHLLYKDREIDWRLVHLAVEKREIEGRGWGHQDTYFNPESGLPWNHNVLTADLSLDTIFTAMAQNDVCIYETSMRVILAAVETDEATIHYRQRILQDCLDHTTLIRTLYRIAVDATDKKSHHYLSDYMRRHPDSMLNESINLIEELLGSLRSLRQFADEHAAEFKSEGWSALFAMIHKDISDEYLAKIDHHLKQLKLSNNNVLLSAELGEANKGAHYLLHEPPARDKSLWARSKAMFTHHEPTYSFTLHPRDDAGMQALKELRDRGISQVTSAVGQSADNIGNFFEMLRIELSFYVGCLNLQKRLQKKGEPTCIPKVSANSKRSLSALGLYDVGLSLTVDGRVVGNDLRANGKDLIVITGTNTGGKSTFLRSVGIAQLLMQAGMFVPAESFASSGAIGIFTHFKREEDASMDSGKFDEELSRMSDIVDHIKPHAMILFNESFAATNEREGSEIGRQIMVSLLDKHIRTVCVTHLFELARGFYDHNKQISVFLRAGHKSNGERTFKMIVGEPLPTSHGEDLYKKIFIDRQNRAKV